MGSRLRRGWLRLHRWLALTLGLPLAVVALLGAVLLVLKPIDHWRHAELFSVAPGPAASDLLERVRQRLGAEFGPGAALTFRLPRLADESLRVAVRGPWDGTIYLDPRDASELGRRGEHEGAFNLLFEIHSALLLNETGKPLLALLALAYLVLLIGGLVLWWPKRWRRALVLTLDRGALRALFDLHRGGGALLGLLIGVPVLSGAYMAWRPLSQAVTTLSGQPSTAPPRLPGLAADVQGPPLELDAMVKLARAGFAGAPVGYVQLPAHPGKPIRVRLRLADDPHPNGLSSVWLHPHSGRVLAAHRWSELDPGARAYSVIYPLHTGELGGLGTTVLNGLLGLALAGLGGSGIYLWWKRRG
ncbi:putative iron-regulated membrane protein [Paucibacter oligotrophus]|uniref:Putative iron-regulated membrane protein n=1 Tax=Roseateles oligotrophus TaxID=1769250 RepID=A0A840L973_9BURK|nr:PepSY domain-containing protein [Roseateles oligotrophus]MBB4844636.1 putative iron-regulated membrane protein [Roseateles oligotrophus]